MLDGNGAASEAMRLARIGVVSAYPITPQSPISEVLSDYVAEGRLDAQAFEKQLDALDRRYDEMLNRLDGSYQIPK